MTETATPVAPAPMSGPKALQVLRDSGGAIRRASWARGEYLTLEPWAGFDGREVLLKRKLQDAVTPFICWGEDLRAGDWEHIPAEVPAHG